MFKVPIPREWSNDELRKLVPLLGDYTSVINVSGWRDQDKQSGTYKDYFKNASTYTVSNYDEDTQRGGAKDGELSINLDEQLSTEFERAFDIAFSHTVLEHVIDPVFAFEQIAKLTNDLIITVVPFKQKMHFEPGQYGDYYRFTPMMMRRIHEKNGFEVLYESFTPRPSLDVYLLHIGTRNPEKHRTFPRSVAEINKLNFEVGAFNASDLAKNIFIRAYRKYFRS